MHVLELLAFLMSAINIEIVESPLPKLLTLLQVAKSEGGLLDSSSPPRPAHPLRYPQLQTVDYVLASGVPSQGGPPAQLLRPHGAAEPDFFQKVSLGCMVSFLDYRALGPVVLIRYLIPELAGLDVQSRTSTPFGLELCPHSPFSRSRILLACRRFHV